MQYLVTDGSTFTDLQSRDTTYTVSADPFRVQTRDLTPTFGSPLGAQLIDVYVHEPGATSTSTKVEQQSSGYGDTEPGLRRGVLVREAEAVEQFDHRREPRVDDPGDRRGGHLGVEFQLGQRHPLPLLDQLDHLDEQAFLGAETALRRSARYRIEVPDRSDAALVTRLCVGGGRSALSRPGRRPG